MAVFPHQRHVRYGKPHLPHLALRLKLPVKSIKSKLVN